MTYAQTYRYHFTTISMLLHAWRFPTIAGGKHFTTRGIYDARVIPRPRKNSKEVLNRYLIREGLKLDDYELKGKPIRFFNPQNTFSAPRVLLVAVRICSKVVYRAPVNRLG